MELGTAQNHAKDGPSTRCGPVLLSSRGFSFRFGAPPGNSGWLSPALVCWSVPGRAPRPGDFM
eukprot:13753112-Alexandrium_andersonii.AAC.1